MMNLQNNFSEREIIYIKNILWGLEYKGLYDNPSFEIGIVRNKAVLHIDEPFIALNYLGFGSPSNITLIFTDDDKIEFWGSSDNGKYAEEKLNVSKIPDLIDRENDFNHFLENVQLGLIS